MISYQLGSTFSIVYIAFRVSIANLSPITDCDEVFNYWEPLHFMLYGTGMQTWEYAPQYALRTYAYLLPMAGVAKLFQFILDILPSSLIHQLSTLLFVSTSATASSAVSAVSATSSQNKPLLFAMLRSFLAFVSCYSELSFLHAIQIQFPSITTNTITTVTTTTKNNNSYNYSNIAHCTALASMTSTGLFHASQAYLPSSSVMIVWRMSISNQLMGNNDVRAVLWGLVAVLCCGWPFCAVLFLTTGFWTVWKAVATKGGTTTETTAMSSWRHHLKPIVHILLRTSLHAILLQSLVMIIDHHFYGQFVSPIWNIFAYNATSGGDELYGIEPLSYYIKNLLLNLNFVAVLGIASGPILVMKEVGRRMFPTTWSLSTLFGNTDDDGNGGNDDNVDGTNHDKRNGNDDDDDASMGTKTMMMLVLLPMYLWVAIVLPRPHKEERFLFPIYPMLCFGAAITVNELLDLLLELYAHLTLPRSKKEDKGKNDETTTTTTTTMSRKRRSLGVYLGMALLCPSVILSISRSFALHHYYSAPLMVYRELFHRASSSSSSSNSSSNDQTATTPATTTYVCTAGEWYRFPSSFFLPPNHQLGFLKSSFTGQLPQPYTKYGSRQESLTLVQGNGKFNDVNEEEMDRYVDIGQCSYVVELVPNKLKSKPNNNNNPSSESDDDESVPEALQYMELDDSSGAGAGGSWTQLASYKYLDAESTPLLHRILYLPFGRDGKVIYKGYNLYGREQTI